MLLTRPSVVPTGNGVPITPGQVVTFTSNGIAHTTTLLGAGQTTGQSSDNGLFTLTKPASGVTTLTIDGTDGPHTIEATLVPQSGIIITISGLNGKFHTPSIISLLLAGREIILSAVLKVA